MSHPSGNPMAISSKVSHQIYGSSRLGEYRGGRKAGQLTTGRKSYELSNHLGNVLAVVSDAKVAVEESGSFSHFAPEVLSTSDYYPFGLAMEGRTSSSKGYRFGFNGMEKDEEMFSDGYAFKYRIQNAKIGRFLSVDPLAPDYPWNSTYAFAENRVIDGIDLEGLEFFFAQGAGNGTKSALDMARDFQLKLKVNDYRKVDAHFTQGYLPFSQLKGMAYDAWFAMNSKYASVPVDQIGNEITDYRVVKAYKELNQYDRNNTDNQLNIAGYSFGSVLMAQASIMLLINDESAKIDNLILIGTPISKDSPLYKRLEEYKASGRIGEIHYEFTPGDAIVGSAALPDSERKKLWWSTFFEAASGADNKHVLFSLDTDAGHKERKRIADNLLNGGVKNDPSFKDDKSKKTNDSWIPSIDWGELLPQFDRWLEGN